MAVFICTLQFQPPDLYITSTSQTHEQLPWILDNPFGPYVATPVKYRLVTLIVWTNRNHFQVIAETGQTGQLQYDSKANPEDKDKLDFSEPAMLFYAQESTTRMTRNTIIAFHRFPAR